MKAKVIVAKMFAKPWAKGAIFGFIFGALIALISAFELFQGTILEKIPQVFGALPVYAALKLLPDVPEFFLIITFFTYWIALGALIGWAINRSKAANIAIAVLVLVLLFAHIKANIAMQREIEGAVSAFVEFIRVFGQMLPNAE